MTKEEMYKALEDYKENRIDHSTMARMYEEAVKAKVFTDEEHSRFRDRYWAEMLMKD